MILSRGGVFFFKSETWLWGCVCGVSVCFVDQCLMIDCFLNYMDAFLGFSSATQRIVPHFLFWHRPILWEREFFRFFLNATETVLMFESAWKWWVFSWISLVSPSGCFGLIRQSNKRKSWALTLFWLQISIKIDARWKKCAKIVWGKIWIYWKCFSTKSCRLRTHFVYEKLSSI